MKIAIVYGTRPQYIKLAPLLLKAKQDFDLCTIDTGQHYDKAMSENLISDLQLPRSNYQLNVGSGILGQQLGKMLSRLEPILKSEKPNFVLVMGDTNSTLAGALMASRLGIPIGHIEAGLRSHDKTMPEETNRLMVDAISDLHFCPSEQSRINLYGEGHQNGVHLTGDIIVDSLEMTMKNINVDSYLTQYGLIDHHYLYLTLHRPSNVDDKNNLKRIIEAMNDSLQPIVFPIHPRTLHNLTHFGLAHLLKSNIICTAPVSHHASIALTSCASRVLTDSGGLQKEAYLLKTPCITLRDSTEWEETVAFGWNRLVGNDPNRILESIRSFSTKDLQHPDFYGRNVAEKICTILRRYERYEL